MGHYSSNPPINPVQVLVSCEHLLTTLASSFHTIEPQLSAISTAAQETGPDAQRLSAILKVLPAGVVVIDGEGVVTQCNPAAEDLLGIPLTGETWRGVIDRAFAPRADDGHDISLVDGRIVNISTSPLGDVPGQLVLLTDVTKTREMQTRMSRNERLLAMGQMAANMAHQIRTPLSAALLYASQLKSNRIDQTQRLRVADRITSSIQHLEHLVNDMLMYASGGSAGEEEFELNGLISELVQGVQLQLVGSAIEVRVKNEGAGLRLNANRGMVLSCMQNLASNAIEAMGDKGCLTVTVRATSEGGVDLMITDTGAGILPEHQANIFEPFFTTRARGTGLGLAVVKLIARAHQGDAWFQSVAGQGSTFAMRLPVKNRHPGRQWANAVGNDMAAFVR